MLKKLLQTPDASNFYQIPFTVYKKSNITCKIPVKFLLRCAFHV